ncbi:Lysylphosphatidylglycerol synthase TM region [Lachnospiraceae bacterium]|nr:Lysylphosphatidylglycerol synthase TM region [Lachnospiraceae bacterium]
MITMAEAALFLIFFGAAHIAKFIRFYLVLMEEKKLAFVDVLFLYFRTTFINLVIPFKLGEIYRVGAVFHMTGSVKTGVLSVIMDRFFDTTALLAIILPFELFFMGRLNVFPAMLFLCLLIMLFVYLSFAPSYRFMNRYLVTHKKSERAMAVLAALDGADEWYHFARRLISGRSPMILLASFIGWGAEFMALRNCAAILGSLFNIQDFNSYINSIFMAGTSSLGNFYHMVAVVLIAVAMILSMIAALVKHGTK